MPQHAPVPASSARGGLKVYHGYGYGHQLVLYGHTFRHPVPAFHPGHNTLLHNVRQLIRLFNIKPLARASVRLYWYGTLIETVSEQDGFFRFEWNSATLPAPGWHHIPVELIDAGGHVIAGTSGSLYIPPPSHFAVISDIDDTIMVSHSATLFRRLRELLFRSAQHRKTFEDVVLHYQWLSHTDASGNSANPFFYVSSSEWNLYDYLDSFFSHNGLPKGIFLLNQIKRWQELWRSGKTNHNGKLLRIVRIFETFPRQDFVLLGDNSQNDPGIYAVLCNKYPKRIRAVYIRNVRQERRTAALQLLAAAALSGIPVCVYKDSSEAIAHSRSVGLI